MDEGNAWKPGQPMKLSLDELGQLALCLEEVDAFLACAPESRSSEEVEKLAGLFAMEFFTSYYRPLRAEERPRFEQLKTIMLAFAAQLPARAPWRECAGCGASLPVTVSDCLGDQVHKARVPAPEQEPMR